MCVCGGGGGDEGRGLKDFYCQPTTLGPDATLSTEIHKNSVRIKAPNSRFLRRQPYLSTDQNQNLGCTSDKFPKNPTSGLGGDAIKIICLRTDVCRDAGASQCWGQEVRVIFYIYRNSQVCVVPGYMSVKSLTDEISKHKNSIFKYHK